MSRSGLCAGMCAADGASPGESAFVPRSDWGVDELKPYGPTSAEKVVIPREPNIA